jgi:sarcosine oxidase
LTNFDRIVVGLGGVGSAALRSLAKHGIRVLGLEQFGIAHDRGSSHGQTRIIRQGYFEHPNYVPLVQRADALWCELEQELRVRLFDRVGIVEVGPPDGRLLRGVELSATRHQLPIEHFGAVDSERRFPMFSVPAESQTIFEPTAGLLYVERCVSAQAESAQRAGAILRCGETVLQIESSNHQVQVTTDRDKYVAGGVVICGGAWSQTLTLYDLPLRVVRKHLHWFPRHDPRFHIDQGVPVFLYERPHGYFYGFPAVDSRGVKVAEHSGGESVKDPTHVDRTPDSSDRLRVCQFVEECLPYVVPEPADHAVCMYTLTPDEHFVIDWHPRLERTVFAAGLSGHGFKFAPALGETLADLSLHGATQWDIEFLSASRFSAM